MMALIGAFTFEFEVSLPLLAETTFHGTRTTYSWLIGALGAGAIAGGLYAARSARTGVARLTRAALGYAIAVGLVAVAPTFPAAVAACVLAGVATVIFLTTGNATIQLASDPEYRGRVTALWSMALVGTTPIGSPVIGALSDVASPRYALGLGAAACLAAAISAAGPPVAVPRTPGACHPRYLAVAATGEASVPAGRRATILRVMLAVLRFPRRRAAISATSPGNAAAAVGARTRLSPGSAGTARARADRPCASPSSGCCGSTKPKRTWSGVSLGAPDRSPLPGDQRPGALGFGRELRSPALAVERGRQAIELAQRPAGAGSRCRGRLPMLASSVSSGANGRSRRWLRGVCAASPATDMLFHLARGFSRSPAATPRRR